jgi:glucans biosynthesis protein C
MSIASFDEAAPSRRDGMERLVFVDALRVAIIVFVIVHHSAQAYGPTGGAWPVHDSAQSNWFLPFYTANAAFGMGLLFVLAGYFVPSSYEKKGPRLFLRERWVRIGVPLVSLVLLVHLPAAYLIGSRPAPAEFIHWLYERGWQPIYLHLWFVAHLMLYSAAYVAWRQLSARSADTPGHWPPSHLAIVGFVVVLALATWVVRVWYPVDTWVPLFWIMPAEPAHLPQYVALFAVGIAAHRGDWFRKMPTDAGTIWLGIGLIASAGIYLAYMLGPWHDLMTVGGLNLPSLVRSTWETVIAVGLSVGLIVAFREMFSRPNPVLGAMAAASFGAYILHPAIVVALQAAIRGLALHAFVKFALVSALGTLLAFWLARLSAKVPGLRAVLGTADQSHGQPRCPELERAGRALLLRQ